MQGITRKRLSFLISYASQSNVFGRPDIHLISSQELDDLDYLDGVDPEDFSFHPNLENLVESNNWKWVDDALGIVPHCLGQSATFLENNLIKLLTNSTQPLQVCWKDAIWCRRGLSRQPWQPLIRNSLEKWQWCILFEILSEIVWNNWYFRLPEKFYPWSMRCCVLCAPRSIRKQLKTMQESCFSEFLTWPNWLSKPVAK